MMDLIPPQMPDADSSHVFSANPGVQKSLHSNTWIIQMMNFGQGTQQVEIQTLDPDPELWFTADFSPE